jgi:pimeloyl-ACP methyl ester carboxylesterase
VTTLTIPSESETLQADVYGELPARRVAILVHGGKWDGSGWREVAPRFAAHGVPALALNLRGYDGSTGKTNRWSDKSWTAVTDLRAAKALVRSRGAEEIALVGASMGGRAILASSWEGDVECVVSVSAPVTPITDEMSRRVTGRKLYVCADEDTLGAAEPVLASFAALERPKTLLLFGGKEHARAMFAAPYGEEAVAAIVEFVCRRA